MEHNHPMGDDTVTNNIPGASYFNYPEDNSYIPYTGQMPYPVGQHAPQTRALDMHQPTGMPPYPNLGMLGSQYHTNVYAGSPPHGSLPLTSGSPAPPSPGNDMYGPLSPPVSGSETSGDGLYHHSNSSGANSPSSSRANSLVHRSVRYNPTPSPTSSAGRRRGRSHDSDDEDNMGMPYGAVENLAHSRKEATRRQRIEAEQRRRDELRDGYAKLKDVLPVSNQKSSKVSLLERATNHILALDKANKELQARINALEAEMQRLRGVNEKISLSNNNTPSPGHPLDGSKPISPPPEGSSSTHSLTSVKGQLPPSEHSSPSASENGYQ